MPFGLSLISFFGATLIVDSSSLGAREADKLVSIAPSVIAIAGKKHLLVPPVAAMVTAK